MSDKFELAILAAASAFISAMGGSSAVKGKATATDEEAEAPAAKPRGRPPGSATKAKGPDYNTEVKPLILKLNKLDKDVLVSLLGEYETADGEAVTKGPELQASDYPEFIEKINAAIEENDI